MTTGSIIIRRVWRSQAVALVVFGLLSVAAIVLSKMFPALVVRGDLLEVSGTKVRLALPLLWFGPALWLGMIVFRIYNVRYVADGRGIEVYDGILSLGQQITRVRYEDIRSIESDQTLLDRLLDIGTVQIGTAASTGVEMHLEGIAAPKSVQEFIQNERDRRQLVAGVPETGSALAQSSGT